MPKGGFRARIDGELRTLDEPAKLDKRKNHTIEVVIDRLVVKPGIEQRLENSIQTALKWADGLVIVSVVNGPERSVFGETGVPQRWDKYSAAGAAFVFV